MATPRVAILIPAYNEESTIGGVVSSACEFGKVIVSDDGSSDATAELARRNGAVVISQDGNRGYDSALAFGLSSVSLEDFDFVVTMDADGQHDFTDILSFVNALVAGADLVVGTRPQKARFMEKVFGLFTRCVWGVIDPLCGMKGYKTSLLREKGDIKTYNSVGTEVLMFALTNGFRVDSVQIAVKARNGKPRFAGISRANIVIGRSLVLGFLIYLKALVLSSSSTWKKQNRSRLD